MAHSSHPDQETPVQPGVLQTVAKQQWQHCSLFNLDLFNDDQQHVTTTKNIIMRKNIEQCCCSSSTPNVDDPCGKHPLHPSCSFVVLQKNYTTHLEHVAENLLADDNKTSNNCAYCSTLDSKGASSLNRKMLLGSTAILDSFLRNHLKTSTNSNPMSSAPVRMAGGNQRRWHSERTNRHPNVRANLPLTLAQRQVLERYINDPSIKPPTDLRSSCSSHHQPIIGKAGEATGTALAALSDSTTATVQLRKNSAPLSQSQPRPRPLSSTSSSASATSHHRCALAENIESREDFQGEIDDDIQSISSDDEPSSEDDLQTFIPSTIDTRHATPLETLSECGICCETRRLPRRHCCPFYACSTCLNTYVEEQIRLGIIRIPCPNQQCQAYMHRDEINKRCLSPELRQRLTRFVVDANRAINVKTCPRCSNIHEIDLELCRSKRRAPTKVQCVECNLIWCFQCHSPWHDGIQCREFRRGDRMLKKWAREVHYGQQNAQQCPSCKVYIQRTKGCDHIVCLRCKTEFCYKCGGRFRDIKFIGDHYSELSVLGCKYRFYPDRPLKRRLIRGSILFGKILAAPILLCAAAVGGAVCACIALPVYYCILLARHIKAKRRRNHPKLNEPVLMSYKTLNDVVPPLIPRDPLNSDVLKAGFNFIRPAIPTNEGIQVEIDPTSNAPIAVFDECDTHIAASPKGESIIPISMAPFPSTYLSNTSPTFPRLSPFNALRPSSSRTDV